MVRELTISGRGVEVVVGKAGAGKTFALDAAREAWTASGHRVIAVPAPPARRRAAGRRRHPLRHSPPVAGRRRHRPPGRRGSVVVVDEAGMVGTRQLARLLDHAEHARAKVVLVGDPHQLPAIDAGGLLAGLATRLPVIELSENRRQREAWERDALDHLRDGEPDQAVTAYQGHDRIVAADTADAAREALVGDWWDAREEHGADQAVMIARRPHRRRRPQRPRPPPHSHDRAADRPHSGHRRPDVPDRRRRCCACATTAASGAPTAPAGPHRRRPRPTHHHPDHDRRRGGDAAGRLRRRRK